MCPYVKTSMSNYATKNMLPNNYVVPLILRGPFFYEIRPQTRRCSLKTAK
jgi:hypothetical protein